MTNIFTLLTFIAVVTFTSCKKENEVPKPEFADVEFVIYDFRAPGDTTAFEVTYPNTMILKADYTWTIDLAGVRSNGTYTWSTTSTQQGDIKFTILNWRDFTLNQILSDKLKAALEAVTRYGYSLQTPSFNYFHAGNYQGDYYPFVRTNKK